MLKLEYDFEDVDFQNCLTSPRTVSFLSELSHLSQNCLTTNFSLMYLKLTPILKV